MALVGTEYEVVFTEMDGEIRPILANGKRARCIILRNRSDFEDRICAGAHFAASLIQLDGSASNPTRMVLHLERQIIRIEGDGLGTDFWVSSETLRLIEADIHFGRAIRLVGPKGSGKTTFAQLLAKLFDVPYLKVDGVGVSKPQDLFGSGSAKDASTTWVPSDLARFIEAHGQRKGWPKAIVCLDEFSRMGHSMAPFHPLFDNTGTFSFTTTEGTLVISGLSGIIFILTDNPVGPGYIGNQTIDTAMSDRVEEYEFGYPPAVWEVPWLVKKTGIIASEAEHIVQVANAIRAQATQQGWEMGGPSPRRTLATAQDVSIGVPLLHALSARIINRYPNSDARSERAIILAHLKGLSLLNDFVPARDTSLINVADLQEGR